MIPARFFEAILNAGFASSLDGCLQLGQISICLSCGQGFVQTAPGTLNVQVLLGSVDEGRKHV